PNGRREVRNLPSGKAPIMPAVAPSEVEAAYDLRVFLDRLRGTDELKTVQGAHWNLEIGALSEIFAARTDSPALLFEDVVEHPRGYRVLSNVLCSRAREALALGLSPNVETIEAVKWVKGRIENPKLLPPQVLKTGPVMENVLTGNEINVLKFPAPKWHEGDG